jgi:hypothetical protein
LEGKDRLPNDNLLTEGLYVSQLERALLENLQVSRQTGPDSKTLPLPTIEEKLEEIIRIKGDVALNEIRDKAKTIAAATDMEVEFQKLSKIISSILGTKPAKILTSPQSVARAKGLPYDPDRINLFHILFSALQQLTFPDLRDQNVSKHQKFCVF